MGSSLTLNDEAEPDAEAAMDVARRIAEALFTALGWEAMAETMAEVGQRVGRWPFPAVPRGTPNVPQSYLVRAEKS